jgi:hypothetical protein
MLYSAEVVSLTLIESIYKVINISKIVFLASRAGRCADMQVRDSLLREKREGANDLLVHRLLAATRLAHG